MKGILIYFPTNDKWFVQYGDGDRKVQLDVRPYRIEQLNRNGNNLQDMDEVEFEIETTSEFPYQWAVPIIKGDVKTESVPQKKTYKKFRINLILSDFPIDEEEIVCDAYDTNSHGYWYFYDDESNGGKRKYLGAYPIERTIIHKIENITVEL
jgi:hypothetical protein